ncbi:MAG: hypothetical protein COZ08_11420, partial [Bacteroidetes bacterium CG_4_10_14_3_um_filter_42_6]
GLGWVIFLLTLVFLFTMQHVGFDSDMMKNNYMSSKVKAAEKQMERVSSISKKTIYLVTSGKDEKQALEANQKLYNQLEKLKKEGLIQQATIVNSLLPSPKAQEMALEKWQMFWQQHSDSVRFRLQDEGAKLGFKPSAFHQFLDWTNQPFHTVNADSLGVLNTLFLDNYFIRKDTITAIINILKVNGDAASIQKVYNAFDGNPDVWVIDKRKITSDFVTILKDNFNKLVLISITLVFIILLLAYGRIELTLITMIPMVLSWV